MESNKENEDNQDLAGPSHAQTHYVPKFDIHQRLAGETRNPLKTLTCVNQDIGKSIPCLNSVTNKCLAGPTSTYNSASENLQDIQAKSESKIPEQLNKNAIERPIPLKFNCDVGTVNPCLAGPSSTKRDSLVNDNEICKSDIMVAASKKDRLLTSSLTKSSFFTPPFELGNVKKVKRSLKRPHSRCLQSLPPFDIDLKNDAQKINVEDTDRKTDQSEVTPVIDNLTHCYTTDALLYLINVERKPMGTGIPDDCRPCTVDYMMHISGSISQSAVVQSAAWCIDNMSSTPRFLQQLPLTAAACVWIVSKLHIGAIHGMTMVRRSNHAFTIHDLALAEKRVLRELKFPTHPVIPQDFIPYLSWWCDPEPSMIESAATFLCLCGLTVSKNIGLEYASVVAFASVKTALVLLQKEEQERMLEKCPMYHLALKKGDISAVSSILRESLHKMASASYEYKEAFVRYSQKPGCIALKLAYANQHDLK